MVTLEAGMRMGQHRYSLGLWAANYMAEELQKQSQRHANATPSLAFGNTQLTL
jgi:hypothetical protein